MVEKRWSIVRTGPARKFALLSAFADDLRVALQALEAARSMSAGDSHDIMLRSHLISSGVIAYWRCFPAARGKPSLDAHIKLSWSWTEEHERSRLWRNRVVAHSDSAMKRTVAYVWLENDEGEVTAKGLVPYTVQTPVPQEQMDSFISLVTEVQLLVEAEQRVLAARARFRLSRSALTDLWDNPERAEAGSNRAGLEWDPGKGSSDDLYG